MLIVALTQYEQTWGKILTIWQEQEVVWLEVMDYLVWMKVLLDPLYLVWELDYHPSYSSTFEIVRVVTK